MNETNNGPSDTAWGIELVDPVIVTHQSRLILFARARSAAVGTLYFMVLNSSAVLSGDDLSGWNGWYRYRGFQGRNPSTPAPAAMAGFIATSIRPSAGATAFVQNNPNGATAYISRSLHPQADGDPLVSGVWLRPPVQQQCAFNGTDSLAVPVAANGKLVPASINLRPQWDWTIEMWVRPSAVQQQRLLTFLDNVTKVPQGAPALAYAVALNSQKVIGAKSYNKQSGIPDSSYFSNGNKHQGRFYARRWFHLGVWIRPDKAAALPPASGTTPLGGIIQVGLRSPLFAVGLTADRLIEISTWDISNSPHHYRTTQSVPMDQVGSPMWSHIAVVGQQDASTKLWSLRVLLDGAVVLQTLNEVELQNQPRASLTIGANTADDTTLFGSIAQICLWSIARTAADIRRTWLTSMTGFEPGALAIGRSMSSNRAGRPVSSYVTPLRLPARTGTPLYMSSANL